MNQVPTGLALLFCGLLAACGGSAPEGPPATEASQASTPAASTPTPTPLAPTAQEDAAQLKKARVTVADLGKPWVQDTKPQVSTPNKDAAGPGTQEFCPGHVTATYKALPVAAVFQTFNEGKSAGANGASFYLFTLAEGDQSALKASFQEDLKACAAFEDSGGLYLTNTIEGPDSVTGADEVVASWAQRIYTDKAHKNLVYFDHTLVTRTGRSFSNVTYGFQASNNSKDKDFAPITRLVEMQVAKTGAVFTT